MTGFQRLMRVEVRSADEVFSVQSDVPISIGSVLDKLGIAHSTVLAVIGDTIIPHTSIISDDVSIELVIVSSGG
jgi:sulfur carrier protein ThiS